MADHYATGVRWIAQPFSRHIASGVIRDELTLFGDHFSSAARGNPQPAGLSDGATNIAEAQSARLEIAGGSGAVATTSARYSIKGRRSRLLVDIEAGQSLAEVARKINRRSLATRIEASVSGNNLVIQSVDVGHRAKLRVDQLAIHGRPGVSGVNPEQIPFFNTLSTPTGGSEILSGTLASTAQGASLRYIGDSGAVVAADARFRLRGIDGTATLSITAGESLAEVAQRINARALATGVTAVVEGDNLLLASTAIGARATVEAQLIDEPYRVTTSGVNPSRVASFSATNVEPGEHVLSGSVTRAASQAELSLRGTTGGVVADGATFELRGSDGAETFSIAAGESLADVAERVNALSGSTGVQASVSGNDLVFRSIGVGGAATVEVDLQHVDHHTTVSGVNSQQVTGFEVQSFSDGASETLNGAITQAAGKA